MKAVLKNLIVLSVFVLVAATAPHSYAGERQAGTVPDSTIVAKRNPCNPCGAKANPCNPCNPCGKSKQDIKPIRSKHITNYRDAVSTGMKLWNDSGLGKSGMSCMTCHDDYENLSGRGWPHYVKMTKDVVTLDQMINFCMINPMEGKQLDPNSIEMTAMSAYYKAYMKNFKGGKKKNMKNPCNPCGR